MNNPVLDHIRSSLGRKSGQALSSDRPAVYPSRIPGTRLQELDLFAAELTKLSGQYRQIVPAEAETALNNLVADLGIHTATVWQSPRLGELGVERILSAMGVELVPPNADKFEIARCDLGVTEADYLLPESGTIVLRSSAQMPRTTSLVPRVHLAIARPEAIRSDLHQVFAEIKDDPYAVFITGPSRTSDIELITTLGVHGPRNLVVWVVGEE
jgi:L-lactate dehydrogenase complex protein LldG